MQRDRIRWPLLGAPLVTLLALGAAAPNARAGDFEHEERKQTRAAEVLVRIDDPSRSRDWFGFDADWLGEHFGIKKKHGVEWHSSFVLGQHKLRLSVNGPLQRGVGRRHLGVALQIQF